MKKLLRSILSYFSTRRGTAVTLLFSLYVLLYDEIAAFLFDYFFHDSVSRSAAEVLAGYETNPALGAAIVVSMGLEFCGLFLRFGTAGKKSGTMIVWIFHLAVSAILAMLAAQSFGVDLETPGGKNILSGAIVAVIIKEIAILFMTFREKPRALSVKQGMFADICLLSHYCVGFTATWSALLRHGGPGMNLLSWAHEPAMLVTNTLAMIILFTLFYLPFRMAYIYGEAPASPRDRVVAHLSVGLSVVLTILPLFRGHTSLESALKEPMKTERLFLASKGLRSLPPEIGRLENLRVLDISGNGLTDLPPETARLKRLLWLKASNNAFTAVPAPVFLLQRLEQADFSRNIIESLSPDTGKLAACRVLNLSHNRLRALPEEISLCVRLKSLNLEHNHIASLPGSFPGLTSLRVLKMQTNCLVKLPPGIETMPGLVEVDLRNNALAPGEIDRLRNIPSAKKKAKKMKVKV